MLKDVILVAAGMVIAAVTFRGSGSRGSAQLPLMGKYVGALRGVGLPGAVRGLLDFAGLGALAATLVFYAVVWGGDALLYRVLGLTAAPWNWKRSALLTDLYGKGVLALATLSNRPGAGWLRTHEARASPPGRDRAARVVTLASSRGDRRDRRRDRSGGRGGAAVVELDPGSQAA